ncbi:large ribosomal subunit protein uL30m [Onthophagus taurus]|uniref:large ribosomal subunit protein uL30m n=1 Tax=Onthophagus taurus TaxID=166361 RepID=UPI0039BE721D
MNISLKYLNKQIFPLQLYSRFASRNAYNWKNEGVQYSGFKYYPKNSDFKDEEYAPSKLFKIKRITTLKGIPHFEKKILTEFKLDGKQSDIAIVKNTPENNSRLWKIKHLIQIVPITFPNGFPIDSKGTFLKENGELIVTKVVGEENKLIACESFVKNVKKLDGDTLRRELRRRWLSGW